MAKNDTDDAVMAAWIEMVRGVDADPDLLDLAEQVELKGPTDLSPVGFMTLMGLAASWIREAATADPVAAFAAGYLQGQEVTRRGKYIE